MLMIKKIFRWITYVILAILALMMIALAIIRFAVFPNINHYKKDIAASMTEKIGLKTTVGNIVTGWDGLSPKVLIRQINIYDKENKPALHLEKINGTLSWLSIPMMHPHLSHIQVNNPKITIHRKANGKIYVAGIPATAEGGHDLANWLLSQAGINIKNAVITWQDDLRQAPALLLNKVNFNLKNSAWRKIFGKHFFSLMMLPSIGKNSPITINGHFFGRDVSKIETWNGELNFNTNEIDLTAWKAWLDYPIDLQSGAGKTKVSLTFSGKKINKLKADVSLNNLSVRSSTSNALLNAKLLAGLLTWEEVQGTTTITGQNIKLDAKNNFHINNGSGFVSRSIKNNNPWINASLKLDTFNLDYLNQLQKVIKFPTQFSQPLKALNPQGKLNNINISFQGNPGNISHYSIKSGFNSLGMNPYMNMPGFNNVSGEGFVSRSIKNNDPWINASLKLDTFNLDYLSQLQKTIKFPTQFSQPLKALNPQGKLNNINISFQGNPGNLSHYSIKSRFNSLGMNPYMNMPGFNNVSGEIEANEDSGTLQLSSSNASLDIKDVLRWPIPLTTLNGKVSWHKNKDKLKIIANDITLANEHINGTLNASYDMNGIKGGHLDLNGQFENGNVKFAPFYYPLTIGKKTINWLDRSIISGNANNVKLTVKGSLDDFPYVDKTNKPDPSLGLFKVTARIDDAVLVYDNKWPRIEALGLNMLFEGSSMVLNADKGTISGNSIIKAKAAIPKLNTYGASAQVLNIDGVIEGAIAKGVAFINTSPVREATFGFTDSLKVAGTGKLNINLNLPLNNMTASTFKGEYTINNGVMSANERIGLPEIANINGKLNFDEFGINAETINVAILGGPATFNLQTDDDQTININASGSATGKGIQKFTSNAITEAMSGSASWAADIAIKKPAMNFNIQSSLKGLAINLPAPLGKTSAQEAYFTAIRKQTVEKEDRFDISYGDIASAIIFRHKKNGDLAFSRGDIGINMPAKIATTPGLSLRGEFDYLNADEWLEFTKNSKGKSNTSAGTNLSNVELSIQQLDILNRSLNTLEISATPSDGHLHMLITGQEIGGDIEWRSPTKMEETGEIIARLSKLHIPTGSNSDGTKTADEDIEKLDTQYPALDIQVSDFKLGGKALGTLELTAHEIKEDWVIEQLKISNPDNILLAEGHWHNWARDPNTNLTFSLTANNAGNTLKRFGQPNVIKGGIALVAGQLSWPGSPHQFSTKGLSGEFRLGASKGQVVKVKPGVGRLFGLLTLQNLPRRLTLDFRDIFSEGFSFDEISGGAKINNGIMHSDDFFMSGPSAETEIKGYIDLNKETQHLNVKVVPHISDSLSLAALASGPVAGIAAFIAQKLLKDPLNKIAQSKYTITGTWDNPIDAKAEAAKKNSKPINSPLSTQ